MHSIVAGYAKSSPYLCFVPMYSRICISSPSQYNCFLYLGVFELLTPYYSIGVLNGTARESSPLTILCLLRYCSQLRRRGREKRSSLYTSHPAQLVCPFNPLSIIRTYSRDFVGPDRATLPSCHLTCVQTLLERSHKTNTVMPGLLAGLQTCNLHHLRRILHIKLSTVAAPLRHPCHRGHFPCSRTTLSPLTSPYLHMGLFEGVFATCGVGEREIVGGHRLVGLDKFTCANTTLVDRGLGTYPWNCVLEGRHYFRPVLSVVYRTLILYY